MSKIHSRVTVSPKKSLLPSKLFRGHVECRFGNSAKKLQSKVIFFLSKWWNDEKNQFAQNFYSKKSSGHIEGSFENPAKYLLQNVYKRWENFFWKKNFPSKCSLELSDSSFHNLAEKNCQWAKLIPLKFQKR